MRDKIRFLKFQFYKFYFKTLAEEERVIKTPCQERKPKANQGTNPPRSPPESLIEINQGKEAQARSAAQVGIEGPVERVAAVQVNLGNPRTRRIRREWNLAKKEASKQNQEIDPSQEIDQNQGNVQSPGIDQNPGIARNESQHSKEKDQDLNLEVGRKEAGETHLKKRLPLQKEQSSKNQSINYW